MAQMNEDIVNLVKKIGEYFDTSTSFSITIGCEVWGNKTAKAVSLIMQALIEMANDTPNNWERQDHKNANTTVLNFWIESSRE